MAIRRFLVEDLRGDELALDPEQAAHARRVLRLEVGQVIDLFDGQGTVARAEIAAAGRSFRVRVLERRQVPPPRLQVDLAVAIPKGDRAATLVEKASELGAARLIPLQTERSVVEPRAGKLERFGRIARESARQCGRAHLMEIERPVDLEHLLQQSDHDRKLLADFEGEPLAGMDVLTSEAGTRVLVLVGPEGGWTEAERSLAIECGCRAWRLGPHILRTETAALAALAIILEDS
ncbi:MAG: 16S rRNA (uracil(1498)-N(3))-methyltransferase [Phycisphaerae bacterium]|nr:16S rRNA (uracil(1498)-N(3))-methyltransferase [Phycisphaerae bacterium]